MTTRTVLVVEDDDDLRETIALTLQLNGYDVREAANGKLALASVEEQLPDVILLDMRMPVMNGWEFADRLHERHGHQVPIILISAAADVEACARKIRAEAWLEKPFGLDGLIQVVGQQLGLGNTVHPHAGQ
jgi:CheY-like chemotaxis protein